MVMSKLLSFIYPPPPSLFVTAMSFVSFASMARAGLSEIRGKHMNYSKFWNVGSLKSTVEENKIPSRTGMLIAYTPAFLASVTSFVISGDVDFRFVLLNSALSIHFFKRIFEVLFIHKYSGVMVLNTVISISLSYLISTSTMLYTQQLSQGFPDPSFDLKYIGIALFFMGISGNLYHHYLLSKLRDKGDKEYKVPNGGLFDFVICPHYLFEILGFIGISCISQTIYTFSFTLGSTLYLMGRSYATRKWYLSKFEDFPKDVKALIPYVF